MASPCQRSSCPGEAIPWEPAELGAFLDHIGTHRLGALFEVIAGTGLRRGEACGLQSCSEPRPNT
ncbi:hypothetical protein [Streptomyces sp. NPDC051286]|uniref:hypothetical protein n=1 Tax=Streptomyces sp. NPDC051286 TaxID=3365647 RepID=UPI0037968771